MKSSGIFVLGVTALVLNSVYGEVDLTTDCRKVMMVIAKKQLKAFGECSREMRANIEDPVEYQSKISCVVRCALMREKLLDSDLQISKMSVQAFLDGNVPKVFHEVGHIFLDNCLADYDGHLNATDPYCKSYGEFVKCMQDRIGEVRSFKKFLTSDPPYQGPWMRYEIGSGGPGTY